MINLCLNKGENIFSPLEIIRDICIFNFTYTIPNIWGGDSSIVLLKG